MTFYVENETQAAYPFDVEQTVEAVARAVLEAENCPYEVQVNVLLTDNQGIREFNRQYRQIDRERTCCPSPIWNMRHRGALRSGRSRKRIALTLTAAN